VSFKRYALIVALIVVSSMLLVLTGLAQVLDAPARLATIVGGLLAAANTLVAYFLVGWAEKRTTKLFLGAVLGGMLGRMAVLLMAVVAAILYFGLPKVPLAVSLLAYFVVFLVFELRVLHQKTTVALTR
jgi:hypothetical protein